MEIDHSLIGSETEPYLVEVERGAIRKFAEAIGDPNPLYRDPDYARRFGYEDVLAPPTFPVTFRAPLEPEWTRRLDRRRILAGEMRFDYSRPIVAGDQLNISIRFSAVDRASGRSGAMELLRQEIHGRDKSGRPVFVQHRTTIYREARQK
jgi:acyl dehydratase